MYEVVATLITQRDSSVKAFWIAKKCKRLSTAQKFIENQGIFNKCKYDFQIVEKAA